MVKRLKVAADTNPETGVVEIILKVPGTYAGIDPRKPTWAGRIVKSVDVRFKSGGANGDYLESFVVVDECAKLLVPEQALFPRYPVLRDWFEYGLDESLQGVWLDPGVNRFTPMDEKNAVPSEMKLQLNAKTVTPRADTLLVNVQWDDGT